MCLCMCVCGVEGGGCVCVGSVCGCVVWVCECSVCVGVWVSGLLMGGLCLCVGVCMYITCMCCVPCL